MLPTAQIRSRLKIWHKFWGVIYPGKLVLYEDENQISWKGTLILSNMQVWDRLVFCFLSSMFSSGFYSCTDRLATTVSALGCEFLTEFARR